MKVLLKSVPNLDLVIPGHAILDKIGEGGMSTVYLARQESLQRKVAVKVIRTRNLSDERVLDRFVNEAKTIARLDHPNIISIYEVNQLDTGIAYYTMPYLPHGDLSQLMSFDTRQLVNLFIQICNGLSFAHDHGVVHRDLKPENLLFDDFGNIIIADFGIALSTHDKRRTLESDILGSSHYMSPEQVQRRTVDLRSDIYAIGSILYEKLTGESLFEEGDDLSVLFSQVNQPVPILPEGLNNWQRIIDTCLAKNPNNRYQNADELASALLEIEQGGQSIIIKSKSHKKWYKKPWFNWSVKTILLAAVGFSGYSLYKINQSGQEYVDMIAQTTPAIVALPVEKPVVEEKPENELLQANPLEMEMPAITAEEMRDQQVLNLIIDANKDLKSLRLTRPLNDNAASKYRQVLALKPDNPQAISGLNQIAASYLELLNQAWDENNRENLIKFTDSLREFNQQNAPVVDATPFNERMDTIMQLIAQSVTADIEAHKVTPESHDLIALGQQLSLDAVALAGFTRQLESVPRVGQLFTDADGHDSIYITPDLIRNSGLDFFNVSVTEVKVADYNRYAETQTAPEHNCFHMGKQRRLSKRTWKKPPIEQNPTHPIICITAQDAQGYANWISEQSGQRYRLPTKQEWLYLQQVSSSSSGCGQHNLAGTETQSLKKLKTKRLDCSDSHIYTSNVGALPANKYGVHDLNGNVSEWVLNCQSNSKNCNQFVAMGTSWISGAETNPTQPLDISPDQAHSHVGFRLVRDIYPD
ncbi:protein kinase [Marinicella sp. W31]|uniref:protein kinase domain-containing protein n=1 Tax=Marinicella sp. W31 TaxID=3023713 RepID=UPI0037569AFB